MELVCEKYKQSMATEGASCRHPKEYCKFRTACMINLMSSGFGQESGENREEGPGNMGRLDFAKGADGLLPAIVQDHRSNEVLMLAYINEEAWRRTLETGKAHYWSRSRNKLWLKGETSGHIQLIREILVDCDRDTVIYRVEQLGGAACHTGHRSCFFRRVEEDGLKETDGLVFDPREVYSK